MSKGKTCGECHFYNPKTTRNGCGMCTTGRFKGLYVDPLMKACVWSIGGSKRKITNGDRIRRMSNERLAAFVCGLLNDRREETFRSVLDLLNAPAESEGQ